MAEEKRSVVVDFQVQETDAIASLEKTKKSIVELKKEQSELNKAYKDGTVTLDQYAKESVQLEASLKKQQASYNNLQRTVTGLKNPFDKLNDSIKEQAQSVSVAGVSLASFANPATAAVGVLGALFKAYSSSTIGAKDLAFASNQLSASLNYASNQMASFISSAEDGQGLFSKLSFAFSAATFGITNATMGQAFAGFQEKLEDLGREEIKIRTENNQRLEDNAEIMAKLQDSTVSFVEKQHLSSEAVINLRKNEEDLLAVKEQQLKVLETMLAMDKDNEKLQDAVALKSQEISNIKRDTERKVQGIVKLESNILDAQNKQIENVNKLNEAQAAADEDAKYQRLKRIDDERVAAQLELEEDAANHQAFVEEINDKMLATAINYGNKKLEADKKYLKSYEGAKREESRIDFLTQQQKLSNASYVFAQIAGLVDEGSAAYKALAISQATIDTYRAASAALAPPPVGAGPLFGPILAATTIALGLANVAKIIGMGAAAGGGSFMTKGPQLLLVGDNPGGVERVDVTPVSGKGKTVVGKNMIAMAGGGTMYTDAGIMANSFDRLSPQQMQTPTVILTYSEFKEFENTVKFKDSIATA